MLQSCRAWWLVSAMPAGQKRQAPPRETRIDAVRSELLKLLDENNLQSLAKAQAG